ncbi:hypothetical protein [Streptomyces sp. FH025]|uniref:hypothetical protein n=1 Tax=Streptomyces sp. FH025 TaxID=2815937 RepID=UPI001A9E2DCD|nr:hypothetical protein [Streptomyces sp. FH025]MBO1419930.1 hypothetical protein [Streptomyces sp. FH025]
MHFSEMTDRQYFRVVAARPGMFVGRPSFDLIAAFLTGYDQASVRDGHPGLTGWRDWLVARRGRDCNHAWPGQILHMAFPENFPGSSELSPQDDEHALETLFPLLDQFLTEREDQQARELLNKADREQGPDHLEFPDSFDHPRAKAMLGELARHLDGAFSQPCAMDDHIQDASYHALVHIPGEATETGVGIGIRLSNFGDLAVITVEGPGVHDDLDDAVAKGALAEADRRRVEAAVRGAGYALVPERLLHRPYDGVTPLAEFTPDTPPTWWTRFFDHL